MPRFLTRDEIYRILQRELPPKVYPDGAPEKFYSTADMDSVAKVSSETYDNLQTIYDNYWPMTAVDTIADWEILAFGRRLDPSYTLAERQDRCTVKIRSRKGLTIQDMIDVVQSVIGSDKLVDISEWGCSTGGWMINESQLGIETILNGQRLIDATGADLCSKTYTDFGKTQAEWIEMQTEAYTYQVNIYDYTLTAVQAAEIELALSETEPARCRHIIVDGLDSNDMLEVL